MDNLPFYKEGNVMEPIDGRGCKLMYAPSYPRTINPLRKSIHPTL